VKPIHLNLASRPYRDYRPVYAAVVLMSLLTAFLMLNNVDTYYRYIHETKSTRAKIVQRETQTQQERERAEVVKRQLGRLDLVLLDDQTQFINSKLAERAFSWSALLDELETVLSNDVRLISVTPTFHSGGIQLGLQFEAKTSTGLIDTMNRMHKDANFANPFPSSETMVEGGGYIFGMNVEYRPTTGGGAQTVSE
jgi:hypothetical protein